MFENYKNRKKVEAFRKDAVTCSEYDKINRTITLTSGYRTVTLGLDLREFDGTLQLAFSGDLITRDGEALSRVMKAMWNYELPEEFSANEELRAQIFGVETPEPDAQPEAETPTEGETTEGNNGKDEEATKEPKELTPIYFRDMAPYVTGQPNEVIVTVKASYLIDNR